VQGHIVQVGMQQQSPEQAAQGSSFPGELDSLPRFATGVLVGACDRSEINDAFAGRDATRSSAAGVGSL
jgi:hypothetical protein